MGTPAPARRIAVVDADPEQGFAPIGAALRTLDLEGEGIAALKAALENGMGAPFARAVETLTAARGRVIVTGIGKSATSARRWPLPLLRPAPRPSSCTPPRPRHGDLGMITKEDVILAISWSGETVELKPIITYSRRFAVPLIAMTSRARVDAR